MTAQVADRNERPEILTDNRLYTHMGELSNCITFIIYLQSYLKYLNNCCEL